MVLLLALLVRNAISTGAAQWVFLGVVAVAIISCSARVVANIHAEHSGATKDTTTVCDIRAGCKR
ncbi:hypothetical protein CTZ40_03680 [Streptomyces rimosus]|nr:hypothetical protein CTZ40_03680 [Streptomyces rimosus]